MIHHNRIIQHIFVYHTPSPYHAIVADSHPFQDNHIAAYPAMFTYRYGSGCIALVFDGNTCIFIAMVMVVHFHVLAEQCAGTYGYAGTWSKSAIVIKETMFPDFYPLPIAL